MKYIKFASLALAAAFAAPLAAQSATGAGLSVGSTDGNWTVSWQGVSQGAGSNPNENLSWVVNPAGPWQANSNDTKWISAWQSSSAPVQPASGSYDHVTGDNHLYTYTFSTDFSAAAGSTLMFSMGWDNVFQELVLNGVSYTPSSILLGGVDRTLDHFGFCRDDDGAFFGNRLDGSCNAQFSVGGLAANNHLQIILKGDGITDGLWFSGEVLSTPAETVPEPATMTLLATGLAGMAAKSFRRRRDEKA